MHKGNMYVVNCCTLCLVQEVPDITWMRKLPPVFKVFHNVMKLFLEWFHEKSRRHEKRCQMLERIFCLLQCSLAPSMSFYPDFISILS